VFRYLGIVIRHTLNEWKQTLDRWADGASETISAVGEMAFDEYRPFGYIAEDTLPKLFIKVPRVISKLGVETSRKYAQMTEAFDRYKTQFGDKFLQGEPFSMLSTSDPLTEWTYDERVNVLERCHLEWERNPDANAAVTYNRLFSVGGGMQITYRNNAVKEAIEAFRSNTENAFGEIEKTLIDTLQVDGELFLRFHGKDDASDIIMTAIPAWGIKRIKHEPGFIRRVIHYEYQISEDDGMGNSEPVNENVPSDEVIHVAINRKAYELRGRPELYKVLVWLQAHKEWLEDRARQNHYRGSVLYDVTLTNANGAQVAAKLAQYKKPPAGQAAIVVHNDKEVWQKLNDDVNAAGASEDGREMRLKVATGMRLPEYFLADGSNANLASATAQAVPAIYSFTDWQDIARDRIFKPVFLKVLELSGMDLDAEVEVEDTEEAQVAKPKPKEMPFDSETPNNGQKPATDDEIAAVEEEAPKLKIKVRDAFDIKYRSLDDSEPTSVMQALSVATDKEWMSDETAAGLMPYDVDYKKEVEKIAAQRQREMDEISQGLRMAPPQFGFGGPQQPGDDNGGEDDGVEGGDGEQNGKPTKDKEDMSGMLRRQVPEA
jgi:hypothetical protein